MKNFILFFLLFPLVAIAQSSDEQLIEVTIQEFFDGMRAGDSSRIAAVMTKDVFFQTTFTNKSGEPQREIGSAEDFLKAVGTPHDEVWDEKIWSYDIKVDDNLASAWTEYSFYLDQKFSHCGVNTFQLFKSKKGWKITSIVDSRRRRTCEKDPISEINQVMDAWHKAAATADEDTFFGSMTEDCVYIGTDASERWLRDELKDWSKKYFDRDSAWDFTPIERTVVVSKDGNLAWFDETLSTWMDKCRSSGVMQKIDNQWYLKHYHLSIAVPNEKVKGYLELLKKE